MFILTLTAAVPTLHPATCVQAQDCAGPTPWQLLVLLAAFALLVIGAGGIRPCNLAFGADQFDPKTDSGRKGINSFFNWYYFTFTFAMMISATVIIYVQTNVSWALGLAIPTVLMFFSCSFFFVGTRLYVKVRPDRNSPFTSVAQVLVAAFRKRGLQAPADGESSLYNPPHARNFNSKLPYTDQFRFLDKASIAQSNDMEPADGSLKSPWRLCTLQQVEEVKCLLRIIPIWSSGLMVNVAMVQHSSYVVFQALQSDTRIVRASAFRIPAGSFVVFTMLALTIWLPVYDRAILPRLRRLFGNEEGVTLLQRMGIGIVICIAAMLTAAFVEERRRSYALHRPTVGVSSGGGAISSMSSLWLVPQLVLWGFTEAFNSIGQIEFYYKQFPENMRSIAGSLFFCSLAVSNYLSGFMVTVVHRVTGGEGRKNWLAQDLNEGRLDYFYFLIAGMGVLNLGYFAACASWYRYKALDGVAHGVALSEVNKDVKITSPPV